MVGSESCIRDRKEAGLLLDTSWAARRPTLKGLEERRAKFVIPKSSEEDQEAERIRGQLEDLNTLVADWARRKAPGKISYKKGKMRGKMPGACRRGLEKPHLEGKRERHWAYR